MNILTIFVNYCACTVQSRLKSLNRESKGRRLEALKGQPIM